MWDLIVSIPDHCLSFYFTWQYAFLTSKFIKSLHHLFLENHHRKYKDGTVPE